MIARNSPIRPERISSRVRNHCGWVFTMNASPIFTPVRSRTASSVFASATDKLSGFSHRTCFPASAALIDHGTCKWFGSGM